MELADRAVAFFVDNLPTWSELAIGGPMGIAWAALSLQFAAVLKQRGWRTGYTRKTFHFLVFFSAAAIQALGGTPALCLFGGMASLVILRAVLAGPEHPWYAAIAREKDAPHRTYFVVVPYFATLLGGLIGNVVSGPAAVAGYAVTGIGDAVGEPIGTRFGRHRYRVPSLSPVPAERSLEGSCAVWIASSLAFSLAVWLHPALGFTAGPIAIAGVGLACALAEAVSPHGWDNLTLQVVPTVLAASFFAS